MISKQANLYLKSGNFSRKCSTSENCKKILKQLDEQEEIKFYEYIFILPSVHSVLHSIISNIYL